MRGNKNKSKVRLAVLSLAGILVLFFFILNLQYSESISKTIDLTQKTDSIDFTLPDSNISRAIYLNLKSAIAVDNKSGQVIYCYNADNVRPIASLSKLLSFMIIYDKYNPNQIITINKKDAYRSSRSLFRVGDKVKAKDLLHAAMLRSDNRATRALARTVSGSIGNFVKEMNRRAEKLGLENTKMYDPTGLDERNCSTAADCARMINILIKNYPNLAKISRMKKYNLKPVNRKTTKRLINTNKMVFSKYNVIAGKTGYIIESDYCLATVLENDKGEQITIIVLGAPGSKTRFREARRLANYVFGQIR
jgi:serine-type D-Ala-D-Ala endopeptidase (penicillin-binding protein 7)